MTVIKVENLSKQYRLGEVGTGSMKDDIKRWRYRMMGKEDPFLKIGEENDRTLKSRSEYVWALRDINFEVNQGEVLGIIGRNGAGKSTLLKILSRTTGPTIGTIKMKGRVASLLEVGTGFHGELSGRENIYLNGAIMGMRKEEIKSKLDEIIDFAGVEKYIDTPVKRYSSGMYVRLAFAVAAHLEPDIMIVDEVLAVGDAEFQKKAIGKMKDVSTKDGRTVLFVSHNMAAIQNLCDSGLVLEKGAIKFQGSALKAVEKYLSKENNSNEFSNNSIIRKGNGLIKINKIEISDLNDNTLDQVCSGQDFKIKLYYSCKDPLEGLNLIPSISISDKMETPISLHHSRLNGVVFKTIKTEGAFIFTVRNLPLVAALYNISFSLINNGIYYDGILNAIQLMVIDGDYYGVGEVPPSSHGILLLNGEWEIE